MYLADGQEINQSENVGAIIERGAGCDAKGPLLLTKEQKHLMLVTVTIFLGIKSRKEKKNCFETSSGCLRLGTISCRLLLRNKLTIDNGVIWRCLLKKR